MSGWRGHKAGCSVCSPDMKGTNRDVLNCRKENMFALREEACSHCLRTSNVCDHFGTARDSVVASGVWPACNASVESFCWLIIFILFGLGWRPARRRTVREEGSLCRKPTPCLLQPDCFRIPTWS